MSEGLKCPECGHLEARTIDSRPRSQGKSVKRRRECAECGHRWSTVELSAEELGAEIGELAKRLSALTEGLLELAERTRAR